MVLPWEELPDPVKMCLAQDFLSGMSVAAVAIKHGVKNHHVEKAVRWYMKSGKSH